MKLVYFNDFRLGVLKGDTVVDVTSVVQKIPHTGPGDLMNGLIARFAEFRGPLERARHGERIARGAGEIAPAPAEAGQCGLHGGQLYGRRDAQGAGADQRFPQVAWLHRRQRRDHGAAGYSLDDLRG
jgi:hypothetical protein